MANNLDDALFWVQEGFGHHNKKYFVKGSDFADNAKGAEIVWVQRDDEKFWTYHSAPPDGATPDLTYRFKYRVEPVDTWQDLPSNQRLQPQGDGLINFSFYFENPGPYPQQEWKNIRNKQNTFKDLDGKDFKLINNPDIDFGDIVKITHEGGDFEAWYVIDDPSKDSGHVKFQVFKDGSSGERNTCIKFTGTRPQPERPDLGHYPILQLAVYKAVEPYNKIRDTDWVWAQKEDPVTGEYVKYKVSGQNFKELFVKSKPPVTESQGFGIKPDASHYLYYENIQATFTGMKPGYTQEDYINFYKTTSRMSPIAGTFLTAHEENPNGYFGAFAAYWKYDKLKVTADYWEVVLFMDFEDRETGEVTTHSMIATLRK